VSEWRGERLRVAIVGGGPKGLYALERLLAHAAEAGASLDVSLFDPAERPGAGPNYAADLPEYLLMNFAAEQIDMWPRQGVPAPVERRPSFSEWRDPADPGSRARYPARASVGRYLAEGLEQLLATAPATVRVDHRRSQVESLGRDNGKWIADRSCFEEVLLALGHARRAEAGHVRAAIGHGVRLVPAVFPVAEMLDETAVPPHSRVAIRGFALTMIDAVLALTEGRGGRFRRERGAGRMHYVDSSASPEVILPFSHSGRPMLAKTGPEWSRERDLDRLLGPALDRVARLPTPIDVRRDLLPALRIVAAEALARLGSASDETSALSGWLGAATGIGPPRGELSPVAELVRSVAIAAGTEPPDHQWALGYAWRATYPAIVARFGADGLEPEQWPAFRRLARRMERIAFGPPPINAAKLAALIDAGVVDPGLSRGRLELRSESTLLAHPGREHQVDVVVDAVLPGPGAVGLAQPPIPSLLADGFVRVAAGRRGLELTPEILCVGAGGDPTSGLAAIGRPTEDWVIGNDTLSRTLHDDPDRWARRVVESAVRG
jgi:uncharacterized NAD(P)/FAD-binding protein YdhS